MYDKAISYDRETRDFACYLNGELVGFARTFQAAEDALNALIARLSARA